MKSGTFRVVKRGCLITAAILLVGLLAIAILVLRSPLFTHPCLIAAHVEVVDELHEADQTLYLVYRVTGWTDKMEFYELYATLPGFDVCGDSKDKWLDKFEIDRDEGRMIKDVLVRNTKRHGTRLEIRYTRQPDEGVEPTQAKLIRGDTVEPNPEDRPRLWDEMDAEDTDTMETD